VWTGFPYGEFHYSGMLGYTVLGLVPASESFAYTPILLGAMSVAGRYSGGSLMRFALFYVLTGGEDSLPLPSSVSTSLIWVLCFWTGYSLLNVLLIPSLLGVAEILALLRIYE